MSPSSSKSIYKCLECDTEYLRWQGQCDQCQSWNSLEPITIKKNKPSGTITESNAPVKIVDVKEPDTHRWASGFEELDRVLVAVGYMAV